MVQMLQVLHKWCVIELWLGFGSVDILVFSIRFEKR